MGSYPASVNLFFFFLFFFESVLGSNITPPPSPGFFFILNIVQYLYVHCTIPSILGSHPHTPHHPLSNITITPFHQPYYQPTPSPLPPANFRDGTRTPTPRSISFFKNNFRVFWVQILPLLPPLDFLLSLILYDTFMYIVQYLLFLVHIPIPHITPYPQPTLQPTNPLRPTTPSPDTRPDPEPPP